MTETTSAHPTKRNAPLRGRRAGDALAGGVCTKDCGSGAGGCQGGRQARAEKHDRSCRK